MRCSRGLVAKHPYVRNFIRALAREDIFAQVISSMKDHVAPKYGSHTGLLGDLAAGKFETKTFLAKLAERLRRDLTTTEEAVAELKLCHGQVDHLTRGLRFHGITAVAELMIGRT